MIMAPSWSLQEPFKPSPPMPGSIIGESHCGWVAPYVLTTRAWNFAQDGSVSTPFTTMTWFSEDGRILQKQDGFLSLGYLSTSNEKNYIYYGLNHRWKIVIPKSKSNIGVPSRSESMEFLNSSPDSHVFVDQVPVGKRQTSLHIYIDGKLSTKAGPFPITEDVTDGTAVIANEGSIAMLTRSSLAEKAETQVVVFGPDGKQRFRVQTEPEVYDPEPAPDGNGVLIRDYIPVEDGERLYWYTAKGKKLTLVNKYELEFLAWAPKSHTALFSTSVGDEFRYRLINLDSGATRWEIPAPNQGRVCDVILTVDLALFAVTGKFDMGSKGSWYGDNYAMKRDGHDYIIEFHAVDLLTGKVIASWRALCPQRFCLHHQGTFQKLGERLYYVTDEAFSEVNIGDIRAGRNGWSIVR